MKATLSFDLDAPSDRAAHMRAIKSLDIVMALGEFSDQIRQWVKYENVESIPVETLREEFHRILNEHDVNLDMLLV